MEENFEENYNAYMGGDIPDDADVFVPEPSPEMELPTFDPSMIDNPGIIDPSTWEPELPSLDPSAWEPELPSLDPGIEEPPLIDPSIFDDILNPQEEPSSEPGSILDALDDILNEPGEVTEFDHPSLHLDPPADMDPDDVVM